jgi:disulfide bond formation protein DsbB
MYSLAVILLVGALRRDRSVRWYAAPLAAIGAVISTYHYLIEWHPEWEGTSCDADLPCSAVYFREYGFVSLSFMALCGFSAILALLLLVPQPAPAPSEAEG